MEGKTHCTMKLAAHQNEMTTWHNIWKLRRQWNRKTSSNHTLPLNRTNAHTHQFQSECPLTIHSLIIVPMSSPIGCFLLNQANWFNVSGQPGYHGGQLVFSYPASFSALGRKNKTPFVALYHQVWGSVQIMKLCSTDEACTDMTSCMKRFIVTEVKRWGRHTFFYLHPFLAIV